MRYQLYLESRTPLSFKTGRAAAESGSLDYIPGSSLLGALAQAHILLREDRAQFDRFFFEGGLSVGDMYPANIKRLAKSFEETPFLTLPIPATAVSCKLFPGFRQDTEFDGEERHGVYDLLKHWIVFILSGNSNEGVLFPKLKCPANECARTCGTDMMPLNGYYGLDKTGAAEKISARLEMSTRTGIDRRTGTVRQGVLYNREALPEGQFFTGEIGTDPECADDFFTFLKEASESGFLRVGNGRSRGAGEIVLSLAPEPKETVTSDAIRRQVEAFSNRTTELAEEHGVAQPYRYLLPLTLHSDAVLLDRLQRFCSGIDEELWKKEFSHFPAKLVYACSSCRKAIGWNSRYNVPREMSLVIDKGSVFVFGLEEEPQQSFWDELAKVQENGIGERQKEGMGRVSVADIFHLEVDGA